MAKNLGVILNCKLNWKFNIKERVKKASLALNICNKMFQKKCFPRLRMIACLMADIKEFIESSLLEFKEVHALNYGYPY